MRRYLRKYDRSPYWYFKITDDGAIFQDWKSTGKRSKREAEQLADRKVVEAETKTHSVTLDEAIETLAAHKERKGVSDATMSKLSDKASQLRTYFGPSREVHSIELAQTNAYMDKRRRDGVQDSTIELELRELRAALRQLKLLGRYRGEPAAIWPEALKHSFPGRKRWLPKAEYEKLLAALAPRRKGARDWSEHLTVYAYTGMRWSELYKLTAADVETEELHVPGTKTEESDRRVAYFHEAERILRGRAAAYPAGPLFPLSSPDDHAERSAWLRALKEACRRCGIAPVSTNDLRRTYCSWCFQSGIPMELVIMWMGHASSRMVMEVYAQPSAEQGRREMAKLVTLHSPKNPQTDETGADS